MRLCLSLDLLRLDRKSGFHRPGILAHLPGTRLSHDFGLDSHQKNDFRLKRAQAHIHQRLSKLPLRSKLCHRCRGSRTEPHNGDTLCSPAAHSHLHFAGDPEQSSNIAGLPSRKQVIGGSSPGSLRGYFRRTSSRPHGAS